MGGKLNICTDRLPLPFRETHSSLLRRCKQPPICLCVNANWAINKKQHNKTTTVTCLDIPAETLHLFHFGLSLITVPERFSQPSHLKGPQAATRPRATSSTTPSRAAVGTAKFRTTRKPRRVWVVRRKYLTAACSGASQLQAGLALKGAERKNLGDEGESPRIIRKSHGMEGVFWFPALHLFRMRFPNAKPNEACYGVNQKGASALRNPLEQYWPFSFERARGKEGLSQSDENERATKRRRESITTLRST